MAQRIITECDVHLSRDDESVEGSPRVVALMGRSERVIDLCDECAKGYIGPLADLIAEFGRGRNSPPGQRRGYRTNKDSNLAVSKTDPNGKPILACPSPGCEVDDYISRSSLRKHTLSAHDVELAALEASNGVTVEGLEVTELCSECDCGFATPQGLGAHRAHVHTDRHKK